MIATKTNNSSYDITILGAGVAGAFAAYKLSSMNKRLKICIVEFGRPPGKRRRQIEGWLGCFPSSNSRIYMDNLNAVNNICLEKQTTVANNLVMSLFEENGPIKELKNKEISESLKKKLAANKYQIKYNNFVQWKSDNIHKLSKKMAEYITDNNNIKMLFDCEVISVEKKKNIFEIQTELGLLRSKKVINCLGRSGWRLSKEIYSSLGMQLTNDDSYIGFRGEMSSSQLKEWNQSHCTVMKDDITIGPFSWKGTVVPEDHCDLVICSWRSNEDRWLSEKVAFSVILKQKHKDDGKYQTERLSKLAYVLSDNRVGKIRTKEYLTNNSDIKLLPEYDWLTNEFAEINKIIPNFVEKSSIYVPDIITNTKIININNDLSTEIDGLYVCGESGGFDGIYAAALTGVIAATNIIK